MFRVRKLFSYEWDDLATIVAALAALGFIRKVRTQLFFSIARMAATLSLGVAPTAAALVNVEFEGCITHYSSENDALPPYSVSGFDLGPPYCFSGRFEYDNDGLPQQNALRFFLITPAITFTGAGVLLDANGNLDSLRIGDPGALSPQPIGPAIGTNPVLLAAPWWVILDFVNTTALFRSETADVGKVEIRETGYLVFRASEGGSFPGLGPVVSNLLAAPNPVPINIPIEGVILTAVADDSTTGGSPIASAEFSIDDGSGPTPFMPMAATDGAFDEVAEDVTVQIGPFSTAGDRAVCVRGVDAAGNIGSEECIHLTVWASDTTPPQLLEFSFAPMAVDVTGGVQNVAVNWRVTDDLSGVNSVTVAFDSPSRVSSGPTSGQQRGATGQFISGTSLDGFYEGNVSILQFSEAGVWRARVRLTDNALQAVELTRDFLVSQGFPTELSVTSVPDVTGPTVTAISVSPSPVDVSPGPQIVTITLQVADDISGVQLDSPSIGLRSPTGQRRVADDFALVSGTTLNGSWEGTMTIPQFSGSGVWQVSEIFLLDAAANAVRLATADLPGLGLPTDVLTVISVPDDTEGPQLNDFSFAPLVINTSLGPQNVTVTLSVSDNLAGLDLSLELQFGLTVFFQAPSGTTIQFTSRPDVPAFTPFQLISGTNLDGSWQTTKPFPQFVEAGTWHVIGIIASDAVGNVTTICSNSCDATVEQLGFPTDLIVVQPSLTPDGAVPNPASGGVVSDDVFGSNASIGFPPGILQQPTQVAIDVFDSPLALPLPQGFSGSGTKFVNIELTPEPSFPLGAPGLTMVLPLDSPKPAGTALSLFRVNPDTGLIEPALNFAGQPVVGTVNAGGSSATFEGISRLSLVVGLTKLTPAQRIVALQGEVQTLVDKGRLDRLLGRALIAELESAKRQLDRARLRPALLLLQAFRLSVKTLIRLRRLSQEDGQPLIDEVGDIIIELGN